MGSSEENQHTKMATLKNVNSKRSWGIVLSSTLALFLFVSFQYQGVQKYESISESTDSSLDLVPYNPASESHRSLRVASPLGIDSNDPTAPGIAWLMSFPDSGTTFLSLSIQTATKRTIASNYGNMFMHPNGEIIRDQYASLPIYIDRPNGPFLFSELPMPDNYILTKTHCGGICTDCFPGRYVKGPGKFWKECHTSARFDPERNRISRKDPFEYVEYYVKLVKRAIHLIRDPFDNVISR